MSGATREIRLTRGTNRLSSKETYVARLAQRCTLGYDEVLDEVIERGFLNISKPMLKMILEHTFDTMITNTLKDGNSRRLGDYFVLQMEVKGAFDDPGEQFDAEKHRLALKLRPLKALKRKPGRDDIKVYNRNAGPKVVINRLFSASTPENDTLDWFPGCSTVYMRVLWNDIEPEEGEFRWDLFDTAAQNWIAKGKKVAFRIICCNQTETATPQFVRDAGAKG